MALNGEVPCLYGEDVEMRFRVGAAGYSEVAGWLISVIPLRTASTLAMFFVLH